jgi:hypothetical protein
VTPTERLRIAQEILAGLEWDHEYMNCPDCDGEQPPPWGGNRATPDVAAKYDAAHEPGCRWMVAMGKRDA